MGAFKPEIFEPDAYRATFEPLITVTEPGPAARHSPFIQTAALRSSTPKRVTPGAAACADSTHR